MNNIFIEESMITDLDYNGFFVSWSRIQVWKILFDRARANQKIPPSKKEVPQEWVTLRPGLLTGWTLSTNQLESRTKSHTYSWGSSFLGARATHKKEKPRIDTVTGITDTNFLSNATGNGDRKCIWQKDSVCVTGIFLSVFPRAREQERKTPRMLQA